MGKRGKDTDPSSDTSPAKVAKVSEPAASGSGARQSSSTQQVDMLSTLVDISEILKEGFESLKTKVGDVSKGIDKLDDKIDNRFEALEGHSDLESDHEADVADGDGIQRTTVPRSGHIFHATLTLHNRFPLFFSIGGTPFPLSSFQISLT